MYNVWRKQQGGKGKNRQSKAQEGNYNPWGRTTLVWGWEFPGRGNGFALTELSSFRCVVLASQTKTFLLFDAQQVDFFLMLQMGRWAPCACASAGRL